MRFALRVGPTAPKSFQSSNFARDWIYPIIHLTMTHLRTLLRAAKASWWAMSRICPAVLILWVAPLNFAQSLDTLQLDGPQLQSLSSEASPSDAAAKRIRTTSVNTRLFFGPEAKRDWTGAKLALSLFPDVQVTGVIVRTESLGPDRWVGYGHVEGESNSQWTLAVEGDTIAATVSMPRRGTYRILSAGHQRYSVSEIDPSRAGVCGVDRLNAEQFVPVIKHPLLVYRKSEIPSTIPASAAATTNLVTILDVMVVYTGEARAGAGSTASMNTLIDLAVAEANTVYQNSEANIRLRLVHRSEIDYTEFPSLSTNLTRLQLRDDGFMDEVHGLRETNRADVVCLITEHADEGISGLAFTMTEPSSFFQPLAFSVVKRASAVGTYIFCHEISHNLGCQHDRENALNADGTVKPGAFPYSHGHRFVANRMTYRDVMSYAPGQLIPYLSNPNVLFQGAPTGLPGTTNGANNVLTISNTAPIVGAFYGPLVRTKPPLVSLTSPTTGTTFTAGTNLALMAQVSDHDGAIKQVEFYQGNELIGVTTNLITGLTIGIGLGGTNLLSAGVTNFYSVVWTNLPPGECQLTSRAIDTLGASSASVPVQVTVRPRNDDYVNRIAVAGMAANVFGSTRAANAEPNEPMHTGNPGGKSVWYSWTAPKSGTVVLTAQGTGMSPLAEIYKSLSSSSLTSIGREFEFDKTNSLARATFDAIGGETYSIVIDALSGIAGNFVFSLAFQPPPANDNFSGRTTLSGDAITLASSNSAATLEIGEPLHAAPNLGGKSVWFSWNATNSGTVIITAASPSFFVLLDVYIGSGLATLTNVTGRTITFDQTNKTTTLTFDAVAGQSYELAADGLAGAVGSFTLTLAYPPRPSNDDFANRTAISGTLVSLETSNVYATTEAGEPLHSGQSSKRSIWYSWRAPVSGPVTVTTQGDKFFALLDAYTGDAVNTLTNVPGRGISFTVTNFTSTLTFNAVAYRTYTLAVAGFNGFSGPIALNLKTANTPPSFASLASLNPALPNFRLSLYGSAGQKFVIQASTNLTAWADVFTGAFVTNSFGFTDEKSRSFNVRFYRVLAVP